MNDQNDRLLLRLKAIQLEYYFIGYPKSYNNTMHIFCIFFYCDFLNRNGL